MKYIITESRLRQFILDYLDTFLESKHISNFDNFIVISQKADNNDEYWTDYIEFDNSDGRLWVERDFANWLGTLFAHDRESILGLIKEWFEDKFDVEVKYVES